MRELGLSGARRGRTFKVTTRFDERQHRPSDLVERQFTAPEPNRLWVADLSRGVVYDDHHINCVS